MITFSEFCSSLEKIFKASPAPKKLDCISCLKNERCNFQLVLRSDCTEKTRVAIDADIPLKIYTVKEIYSGMPIYEEHKSEAFLNNGESGYFPDLLVESEKEIQLTANENTVLWIEACGEESGEHTVTISGKDFSRKINLSVIDFTLPEQKLIHANWFHSDCLATYYNVEVFSEEYWRITESFIKNAAEHGMNFLLTPVFTPPLDTKIGGERPTVQLIDVTKECNRYIFNFDKLDRWVDIALKNGIKYFEISHLFTQWGAKAAPKIMAHTEDGYQQIFGWDTKASSQKYKTFLKQFAEAFKEYTDRKGITDICYVHCSDEPKLDIIKDYEKAAEIISESFSSYKHIDALSDFEFYQKGLIDIPIPEESSIEEFKGSVPELWTYYCCGQYKNNLPNIFFAMPSIRNRILGVLLYKYNCTGFLHWGFNFYYSQYSIRPVDPFTETDAGGAFPSGDSFIVYPGKDGKPIPSLRQKVFYDAIQDISALTALEQLKSRAFVLDTINTCLGDISFTCYPQSVEKFTAFREKINELIKQSI